MKPTTAEYQAIQRGGEGSMNMTIAHEKEHDGNTKPIVSTLLVFAALLGVLLMSGMLQPQTAQASGTISTCGDCHGYPPVDTTTRNAGTGQFPGSHSQHASTYSFTCTECHVDNTGTFTHRNGLIDMVPMRGGGTYSLGSITQRSNPSFGSCANVYCHSNGASPATYATPTWASGATGACGTCHGVTASNPPSSARHADHVSTAGGYKFDCATCHNNVVSVTTDATTTPSILSRGPSGYHVNSTKDVFFDSTNPGADTYGSKGAQQCTNLYCHSKGTSNASPYSAPNTTAKWTDAGVADCTYCHGGSAAAAVNMTSGSHGKHVVSSTMDCSLCHNATVSNSTTISNYAKHVNKTVDIAFDTTVNPTGVATPATKTPGSGTYVQCSILYCHGAGSPTWSTSNGTLNCGSCHNASNTLAGKHPKHYESSSLATDRTATIYQTSAALYQFNCGMCHYNTKHATGKVSTVQAANVAFDPTFNAGASSVYTADTVSAGVDNGFNYTAGASTNACSNIYCHSQGTVFTSPFSTPVNTGMRWSAASTLQCNGCHGDVSNTSGKPSYANGSPKANSHAAHLPWNTMQSCQACHYATTTTGTSITDKRNHVNKTYTVAGYGAGGVWTTLINFNYASAANGGTCASNQCHAGQTAKWGTTGYNATAGEWNCISCHSFSFTKRLGNLGTIRKVVGSGGDFNFTQALPAGASRHLFGASTIVKWDCIICHREGNTSGGTDWSMHFTDGAVKLRNVDTINIGWQINNKVWNTYDYANMDQFCVACHDTDGAQGIAVNNTNNGLLIGSGATAVARTGITGVNTNLVPFNTTDVASGHVSGSTWVSFSSGPSWRMRVTDVKSQFNYGTGGTGAGYNGNPSQHAVLGPRYGTIWASWGAPAWTAYGLKRKGSAVNVTRDTSLLTCSDCHVLDSASGAHGGGNRYNLWTTSVSIFCQRCHSSSAYANVTGNTGARMQHGSLDTTIMGGTYVGYGMSGSPNCLICHAAWNGATPNYGGIHGTSGTYTAGATYTKYRFMPGVWVKWSPGGASGNDTSWTTNTPTGKGCYFQQTGSTGWAQCSTHSGTGSATKSATESYGRPLNY